MLSSIVAEESIAGGDRKVEHSVRVLPEIPVTTAMMEGHSTLAAKEAASGENIRHSVLQPLPRTPLTSPRMLGITSQTKSAWDASRSVPEVAVIHEMLKEQSVSLKEYMWSLKSQQEHVIAGLLKAYLDSSEEYLINSGVCQNSSTAFDRGAAAERSGPVTFEGGYQSEGSATPRQQQQSLFKQRSLLHQPSLKIEIHPVWCPEEESLREKLAYITKPDSQRASRFRQTGVSLAPFEWQPSRSSSSMFAERLERVRFPLHPESKTRMSWDLLALCFILYDAVTIPLQAFDLDSNVVIAWITAIFWTADIMASLCTGVYVKGELVMRLPRIFVCYVKTWLLLDVCLVASEWGLLVNDHVLANQASMTSWRGFRSFRLIRLLRLMKLMRIIHHVQNFAKSIYTILVLNIINHVVVIIFCNHVIASIWYLIGNSSGDGWAAQADVSAMDITYKYLTSLHWSISQFHGQFDIEVKTTQERAFAVFILMLGLISFSVFISSVTQSMLELQRRSKEKTHERRLLYKYLNEHNISLALSARAKHFLEYTAESEENQRERQNNVAALAKLPKEMLMDIHTEARSHLLASRIIFGDLLDRVPQIIRLVCNLSISELAYSPDQHVFDPGDLVNHTTIIEQGSLMYHQQDEKCSLQKHAWVCEASLWMNWITCGKLSSNSFASCIRIDSEDFAETVCKNEAAYVMGCMYARKFCQAVHQGHQSDIVDYGVYLYMTL